MMKAMFFAPLLLVTLGIGGAWLASLRALEAYQLHFTVLTAGFLGVAFYYLYIQPRRCKPGEVCASPAVLRRQRLVFWIVVAIITVIGALYSLIPFLE